MKLPVAQPSRGFSSLRVVLALSDQHDPGPDYGKPPGAGPPPNINPNIDTRQRQLDESRLRSAELNVGAEEGNQKRLQEAILNMEGGL